MLQITRISTELLDLKFCSCGSASTYKAQDPSHEPPMHVGCSAPAKFQDLRSFKPSFGALQQIKLGTNDIY